MTTRTTPEMTELVERLETVEQVLADLVDTVTARPAGGPWLWEKLDAKHQAQLWTQLGEFVGYLSRRYLTHLPGREHHLPPCWYRHPVAVELLTALMVAHHAAYTEAATEPSPALVDFHERSLWPTLTRLRELRIFTACDGAHQTHQWAPSPWQPGEDYGAFVAQAGGEAR